MVDRQRVVVVGGGPGGYATALYGASAGLDVVLVERSRVGGTCLHVGCIPAKELLETASVHRTVRRAAEFGVRVGAPELDWAVTMQRKQRIVDELTAGLGALLKGRKVTVVDGVGRLGPDRTVTVIAADGTTSTLTGDHVVLAPGSVPRTLPGFDVDGRFVLTSDEVLSLDRLPASAVVVGGGAIGCEFASMLDDLGVDVTLLEVSDKLLPGCDADVAGVVTRAFRKRGITIHTGVAVHGHDPDPAAGTTTVRFGDGATAVAEIVVVSVGRRPFLDHLGLEGTGVTVGERGHIDVDACGRTAVPGVHAVGDAVSSPALAHVAFAEAITVVKDICGESPIPLDHERVPWAIYCHPEVAFAGLTEAQAVERGIDVVTAKHRFLANGRAKIVGDTEGIVKVVAERRPDGRAGRILGVHLAGPWVTEQLGAGYLAVNWEATVDDVAHFLQPHPTMSELFGETVLSLTGRALH